MISKHTFRALLRKLNLNRNLPCEVKEEEEDKGEFLPLFGTRENK